jgi:SEC-C motif-containing protein
MRSRYSAYALRLEDYVFRTWHPRTRPEDVKLTGSPRWTGLEILATDGDTVEFRAQHTDPDGELHELSRFERRAGRWFYLDGDINGSG